MGLVDFDLIVMLYTRAPATLRAGIVFDGLCASVCPHEISKTVMFCSLAVLGPMVGHSMDVLSPFVPVLCHSD